MKFEKPKIEFIELKQDNTIITSAGYTICERNNGINIGEEEWCAGYVEDPDATKATICSEFCDTSSDDPDASHW